MPAADKTRINPRATIYVEVHPELKSLVERHAGERSVNVYLSELLAKALKRPDLATVPRHRSGRPKKNRELAAAS